MSSRARRFLIFIGISCILSPLVLLTLFNTDLTSRQIPRSVPNANVTNYRSPIPPLIHQNYFFGDGGKQTRYRPSKYQMSWQTSHFAYTFYSDAAALTLVRNYLPEYLPTYTALPKAILRTDFFKYAVLYAHGGIYADLDVDLISPLPWPELREYDVSMIIGIEGDDTLTGLARKLQFQSWTIASVPRHEVLKCALDRVRQQTRHFGPSWRPDADIEDTIMDWTGPGIWTDCVTEYIGTSERDRLHRLTVPRRIKDILILPRKALGTLDGEVLDENARGKHYFHGLWKQKGWWDRWRERYN